MTTTTAYLRYIVCWDGPFGVSYLQQVSAALVLAALDGFNRQYSVREWDGSYWRNP